MGKFGIRHLRVKPTLHVLGFKTIHEKSIHKKYVIDSRLQYFKPHSSRIEKTFAEEIATTLNEEKKHIHPKFFYDNKGSNLFEEICQLPEYYLTRTEVKILKKIKQDLGDALEGNYSLVELGSGSSTKTRLVLDILDENQERIEYFPIDISEILTESSEILQNDYENLHITGIIDTYEGGLEFLKNYETNNNLIVFLGSSFGNFKPEAGRDFLKKINSTMKEDDLFLLGLDLVKDVKILEEAYDDSKGVTAKFNLNILSRINDELDGDFNLENFTHKAVYNQEKQRIEMYLCSSIDQSVRISKANFSLKLKKDELILTEYSHKYSIPQIQEIMKESGFNVKKIWTDEKNLYAVILTSKIN